MRSGFESVWGIVPPARTMRSCRLPLEHQVGSTAPGVRLTLTAWSGIILNLGSVLPRGWISGGRQREVATGEPLGLTSPRGRTTDGRRVMPEAQTLVFS